jgi:uncharacterized membrane protein YgdD (TMEM256/DUF423 family)
MNGRLFLTLGAALAGLGVAAGAFGAHALTVTEARMATFETAARYQVYHALALLAIGLWMQHRPSRALRLAGWLFVVGVAVFSGSLYLLVLTDTPWFGAITPLGGVAFLSGWALAAYAAWTDRSA